MLEFHQPSLFPLDEELYQDSAKNPFVVFSSKSKQEKLHLVINEHPLTQKAFLMYPPASMLETITAKTIVEEGELWRGNVIVESRQLTYKTHEYVEGPLLSPHEASKPQATASSLPEKRRFDNFRSIFSRRKRAPEKRTTDSGFVSESTVSRTSQPVTESMATPAIDEKDQSVQRFIMNGQAGVNGVAVFASIRNGHTTPRGM